MAKQVLDLGRIRILMVDVDGVMTDGQIVLHGDGSESKLFNTTDGHGLRMWRRAGFSAGFLSGRYSEPTARRAEQLEMDYCLQSCFNKLPALEELLEREGLALDEVCYMGDDLPDLPVIRAVGFGVAPANAVEEVRRQADYITSRRGGEGAVREIVEYILRETGKWEQLLNRYM